MNLISLSRNDGSEAIYGKYLVEMAENPQGCLIGCEMGVAWGGGVEYVGKLWKGKGFVFGFDTFEGHPKHLALDCEFSKAAGGLESRAAKTMDWWYSRYGTETLSYEYIRGELDKQGLSNVILIKGLITENTDISFIPYLNYCFLDLDIPLSVKTAYNLIKDKLTPNAYLCLHDCVPEGHIHGLWEFYQDVKKSNLYDVLVEDPRTLLVVLRRR